MRRPYYAKLIALCCTICVLVDDVAFYDRQYTGVIRVLFAKKKKYEENRESTIKRRNQKDEYTHTHRYPGRW